jgi:hypothetical protein
MSDSQHTSSSASSNPHALQRGKACLRCRSVPPPLCSARCHETLTFFFSTRSKRKMVRSTYVQQEDADADGLLYSGATARSPPASSAPRPRRATSASTTTVRARHALRSCASTSPGSSSAFASWRTPTGTRRRSSSSIRSPTVPPRHQRADHRRRVRSQVVMGLSSLVWHALVLFDGRGLIIH